MSYTVEIRRKGVFTPRQEQVLVGLARGLTVPQISKRLNVSVHTARRHCRNIYEKMEVDEAQGNAQMRAIVGAIAEGVIAVIK